MTEMMGKRMLYVKVPAKQSGKCPHRYILNCFQSVFDMQRVDKKGTLHTLDESKKPIKISFDYVNYRVNGKDVIRVVANYNKEGPVCVDTEGSWMGTHSFKDERGLEWDSSSTEFYDRKSKMFTNSLAYAYLIYWWGDIESNPQHVNELNEFLVAHNQPPFKKVVV